MTPERTAAPATTVPSIDLHVPAPVTPPSTPDAASEGRQTPTGRWAIRIAGRLTVIVPTSDRADGVAVRELYEASAELVDMDGLRLLIDLSPLTMVGSGLMGMLVTVRKKCLSGGAQCHVLITSPLVMESFTILRLDRILPLYATAEEAVKAFR